MVAYSFKQRFVMPIRLGLGQIMRDDAGNWLTCESVIEPGETTGVPFDPAKHLEPEARPKRQTIRAVGKRRHARVGEVLQLYTGMRTKQCMSIGVAKCTSIEEVVIAFGKRPNDTIVSIGGAARFTGAALNSFARLDGFQDWDEMRAFWESEHGTKEPFHGILIQWEPIR